MTYPSEDGRGWGCLVSTSFPGLWREEACSEKAAFGPASKGGLTFTELDTQIGRQINGGLEL